MVIAARRIAHSAPPIQRERASNRYMVQTSAEPPNTRLLAERQEQPQAKCPSPRTIARRGTIVKPSSGALRSKPKNAGVDAFANA